MTIVERARRADAEALSRFAEAAFTRTFGSLYDPADLRDFLAGWNPPGRLLVELEDPEWAVALVRGSDATIIGFAKTGPVDLDLPEGSPAGPAVELHQLYVAEEAKGSGVADALMDWALAWARERAAFLYLSVFTENPRAQSFYRRYGFVDVGRNPFRVGKHVDEDRIWRLKL